jgi:hypothetical protein
MKRPSSGFIGTVIGSMIVLLVPIRLMHSEEELFAWMVLLLGLGAVIGTVVGVLHYRGS